jgi:hypothetical protein
LDDVKVSRVIDSFVSTKKISKAVKHLMTDPNGVASRNNVQRLKDIALGEV